MDCPYCQSHNTYELQGKTTLGYPRYQCRSCLRRYYERTGTPFNFLNYPVDVMSLIVFHYVRYKLSYEDVAEIFSFRGFNFCGETVRLWAQRFGELLAKKLRKIRHGRAGCSWYVDETYSAPILWKLQGATTGARARLEYIISL